MDGIIIGLLFITILFLLGLIAYLFEKGVEEKQVYLNHIQDLTDKVYFLRTKDFVTNKVIGEAAKTEVPEKKEEQEIPLENVDPAELAEALSGKK